MTWISFKGSLQEGGPTMPTSTTRIVIIGGGSVGTNVALQLE